MPQTKFVFIAILYLNLCVQVLMYCYHMKMLSFRTSETSDYRFSMFLHQNNTFSSLTRVLKPVTSPMWNLILLQHNRDVRKGSKIKPHKTLYNSTYKVCELWRSVKRIRAFGNVPEMLFNKEGMGNWSLKCPLNVGTYVMTNIHVPPDTSILKIIYWPNTVYTLFGNIYSLEKHKKMVLKCTYEINATVVKSC